MGFPMASNKPIFFFLVLLFLSLKLQSSSSQTWIKAGYWTSISSLPVSEINSALFTHLFASFAFINKTSYQLFINSSDEQSFSNFTSIVKLKNPSITTILSIWVARSESTTFSLIVNETSRRKSFIESSVKTARLYGFHAYGVGTTQPKKHQLLVIVLVTVAAMVLLIMALIYYLQHKVFKSQGLLGALKMSVSLIGTKISGERKHENGDANLQTFTFATIIAATNNFSNENKLGEGGYGPVYKVNILLLR
ncbi:hypothetical protein J1N35_045423 [Gossypium stocksii]|uniref:GH18 domain-containing protein n=1 Tax=Gossypium stocksii TaxID=47602 RepID=A0A9D3UB47_9ROSI|nr:hypothetical protein J1N35_045423 [Gossypium stocksii]